MKRTIRVKVGEIVVEGLSGTEAAAFRKALEREIRHQALAGGKSVPVPASGRAAALARQAAGRIGAALPKEVRKP